ncbi:hypothetical protein MUCCIDRAFT_107449 [Mucor lusitanicus CBS 277.49]|uniref:Uncharacterized protein n=1 Tax=Mucor lusitanicus CBS 277.49 TaxID=747725 RepID=A0A168NWZ6_MUCCL|nr:hypothetical protein MUCCIDRAFT_107449 [Mucor lusitanicus CBS 277.49]
MQLFDRLFKIKKHQQKTQNDTSIKSADSHSTSSSTSSSTIGHRHGSIKRFSSLRHWRSSSKPMSHCNPVLDQQQQQQQQDLLTQCIETALYANSTHTHAGTKRWSYGDAPTTSNISFQEHQEPSPPPPAQPRQRKLSLPPQPTHIGYLASIPEVDSQITLDLNK